MTTRGTPGSDGISPGESGTPAGRRDFTSGAGTSALGLNVGGRSHGETPSCSVPTTREPKVSLGTPGEAVEDGGTGGWLHSPGYGRQLSCGFSSV